MNYDFDTSILNIADDFYKAYLRCGKGDNPQTIDGVIKLECLNVPAISNGAFSMELYLKYLIILNRVKKIISHDFTYLFGLLDKGTNEELRKRISAKLDSHMSFDECLRGIDNAFTYWRYIHEKDNLGYGLNMTLKILDIFLVEIRNYCLEKK